MKVIKIIKMQNNDNVFYQTKLNKKPESVLLLVEWDNLRKLMWSENCTIGPWGFVQCFTKDCSYESIKIYLLDMLKMIYQNF